MNYALIGCGAISVKHIQAAMDNKTETIAVCDIYADSIVTLLNKFNLQNDSSIMRYTDYKTMISENDIDIVAIATGSGTHAEIALYCIEKGINVILEKPIALSIEDADRIIESAAERKVKVTVCHPNRFNASVQQMRVALESGRFGKTSHGTVHIRWNRNKNYYSQAAWRGTWASDGGALMNQCIHGIDMLRWMMDDEIEEVYGATRRRHHDYIEAEDLGVAVIKFKSGSVATIEGTVNIYQSNLEETLYLFGEKGTVKLGGKSMDTIEIWDFANDVVTDEKNERLHQVTEFAYGHGHSSIYADMLDSIKNDREPYVNAQEGKKALELVLAIYKSQKEGIPVKLPLSSFSVLDMAGEFDGE